MFTGLIAAVGRIESLLFQGEDARLTIVAGCLDLGDVALGDSIAVNGVCLTVVVCNRTSFGVDISIESLNLTTLKDLKSGSLVNLEKALQLSSRLGGHLVSGHVDGVGHVVAIERSGRSYCYRIKAPKDLLRYITVKGSICIDGVSLTVNYIDNDTFGLNVIPHTQDKTIITNYRVGSKVNLEVDLLARYLERLLNCPGDHNKNNELQRNQKTIDENFLRQHGFI
ncbi:riboflavin synthase subunit alpha [Piscirickettsia salmonis]|uniref:Riboflavin synthase n=1 Tax=Piscirickettsia salmonis TaxID=1238 RepID=A0A9Q6LKS6_PISSA|nr:riboflavin synthase [Piscirickettsia salmonis]ALA25629.1 riboflavin synthase, alpha subunit [Piscirickettsia salmonis]APS43129.1 riboflavin synthase subunit alpha [Piscirickettsia salmonis]APS46476.1 riboflavin synthase subunit alpha [Piscirickettsia salmonis]APS50444.1 riboflavin synthase subunit alpha [Piscirickettsia salmonis]APS53647.1 riboflavin synthase subunit alpha [Piscirickettsia salmonis]